MESGGRLGEVGDFFNFGLLRVLSVMPGNIWEAEPGAAYFFEAKGKRKLYTQKNPGPLKEWTWKNCCWKSPNEEMNILKNQTIISACRESVIVAIFWIVQKENCSFGKSDAAIDQVLSYAIHGKKAANLNFSFLLTGSSYKRVSPPKEKTDRPGS